MKKNIAQGSKYVEEQRREYSLYVLQNRAIVAAADGLKPSGRRVLWVARDGKKYKSATLGGAAMPLHPHASPEGAINTLAAPYGNNMPLFETFGAFGTMLNPTAYGASRYTSVKVSEFTKDVVFADIEIIPMMDNYDGTLQEPRHFLPLVPIALLNSSEGIAVGFASNILPRGLSTIINDQIEVLSKKKPNIVPAVPTNKPTAQVAVEYIADNKGGGKWKFVGTFRMDGKTKIKITSLPHGLTHEKFIDHLIKLVDDGTINDYTDRSKNTIDVLVELKRGCTWSRDDTYVNLNLITTHTENLNVLTFDGQSVWSTSYTELVTEFTKWRLEWYSQRYEYLREKIQVKIQRNLDIIQAINKNVGGAIKKIKSRAELKELLEAYGIIHLDYIADLPIYRFTEEEKTKVELIIVDDEKTLVHYNDLLNSQEKRVKVYINELKDILKKYG